MPGTPTWVLEIPKHGTKHWLILKDENYEFAVFCGYPAKQLGPHDVRELLAVDRDIMLRNAPGSQVAREESISWKGFPGQEMEIHGPSGQVCLIRVYHASNGATQRLYKLLAGGFGLQAGAGAAARFFDSFRLEDMQPPQTEQPP
jgi:hypothetical protein